MIRSSSAVVACATLWLNLVIRIKIGAKISFIKFQLRDHELFVKWTKYRKYTHPNWMEWLLFFLSCRSLVSIYSCNGWVQKRQQAIAWIDDDTNNWHTYIHYQGQCVDCFMLFINMFITSVTYPTSDVLCILFVLWSPTEMSTLVLFHTKSLPFNDTISAIKVGDMMVYC